MLLRVFLLAMLLGFPAQDEAQPPGHLRIEAATFTGSETAPGAGTVVLEIAEPAAQDPADSVRLQAVLQGPLDVEGEGDGAGIYALSAVLSFPASRLSFVTGSLIKGELLGRDGRDTLITAGVTPGDQTQLTIGASRIGAVPGVQAPKGRSILFSLALQVLVAGDTPIVWGESALIDPSVRATGTPRFVDGTLHVEGGEVPQETEEH